MSIFDRFIRKNTQGRRMSFESLHTDMHSHLIPGIDDGVKDLDTAVSLIGKMKELGFKKLITTPHIMTDLYKNNPTIINKGLNGLRKSVAKAGIDIQIEAAAEYQVDDGLIGILQSNELMSFGDQYVMIELPYYNAPENLNEVIFEMQVAGYKIILAHPERYMYWHNKPSKLEELKNKDVYFQLNTISLSGYYSYPTRKMARRLIQGSMIDFLGSDLHNHQSLNLLEKAMTEPELEKLMESGKLKNHLI